MISSVQRDCLADHPYVVLKLTESRTHVFDVFEQQSFARWKRVEKLCNSSLNKHALADTRLIGCNIEPTTDRLTQPNRYFAPRRRFALARGTTVNAICLRIHVG